MTRGGNEIAAALVLVAAAVAGDVAIAHTETGDAGGFLSGLMHPVSGPDHVIAMVAVGLWGVYLGAPAIWVLPIVFPLIITLGGVFGMIDVQLARNGSPTYRAR